MKRAAKRFFLDQRGSVCPKHCMRQILRRPFPSFLTHPIIYLIPSFVLRTDYVVSWTLSLELSILWTLREMLFVPIHNNVNLPICLKLFPERFDYFIRYCKWFVVLFFLYLWILVLFIPIKCMCTIYVYLLTDFVTTVKMKQCHKVKSILFHSKYMCLKLQLQIIRNFYLLTSWILTLLMEQFWLFSCWPAVY